MTLVIISPEQNFRHEIEAVSALFDNGLECFHLRKPNNKREEIADYLNQIPKRHLDKIVLHTHFDLASMYQVRGLHINKRQPLKIDNSVYNGTWSQSVHDIEELMGVDEKLDYVFISPIYDSLSKSSYRSAFGDKTALRQSISEYHSKKRPFLVALGGVDAHHISELKALGFDGVACIGAVWGDASSTKPEILERFNTLKSQCQ